MEQPTYSAFDAMLEETTNKDDELDKLQRQCLH